MSELKNEKQITWSDIEVALATEIVEESKKKSRQDFMNKLLINAVEMNKAREDWDNLDNNKDEKKENEE